jgi:hypothetical protein
VEPWRTLEDDFLLANPSMTAKDAGSYLGRTSIAVDKRRRWLVKDQESKVRFGASPLKMGARPLLAKTCPSCGLLLQAKWFGKNSKKWSRDCTRCISKAKKGTRKYNNSPEYKAKIREAKRKYQELTLPGASRKGQPWTESDMAILGDPDLTIFRKALTLHRTHEATRRACQVNGFKSFVGLGDPDRDQWMIDNPNADRFEEITASLVTETQESPEADEPRPAPSWDWDDADLVVSA